MTQDRNDTPLEQADALYDLAEARNRLDAAEQIIQKLDPDWPHKVLGGCAGKLVTAICQHCDEPVTAHKADCLARRFLNIK